MMRYSKCISSTAALVLLLASLHIITAIPAPAVNVPNPVKRSVETGSAAAVRVAPAGVDEGDATKRFVRGSGVEEYEDDDDPKNIAPELIPIAESRKARGNGADDLNAGGNGVDVVEVEGFLDGIERVGRDGLDGDVLLDSNLEGRSEKCSKDGETCKENSGCCSGFCSWTRDFTCYTVAG